MRQLTLNETAQISGAKVCGNGVCIAVNPAGIPLNHINIIESTLQAVFDGRITLEQAAINIYGSGCRDSFEIWNNRLNAYDLTLHFA